MYNIKSYKEIEEYPSQNILFIDVRSESEYKKEHIPGAINFPVLDDSTRKRVGTLYKQGYIDQSKTVGVTHISKKLPGYFSELCKLSRKYDHLIFYCARGGYRSSVLVGLLQSLDIPAEQLLGGYKGYRKYIRHALVPLIEQKTFVVLDGLTGCGKTEILKELKNLGGTILDLEGLANHRGSLLGGLGLGLQPSQKQFESSIYHQLKDGDTLVFTEGESTRIGHIILPRILSQSLANGIHVRVSDTFPRRVERIYNEYGKNYKKEELYQALDSMEKYISQENIYRFKKLLEKGETKLVISQLIEGYYDPKYRLTKEYSFHLENIDSKESAKILLGTFTDRSENIEEGVRCLRRL
ncbi:MAG: tRNA 2-selenouridine(34) synthase MnmH [Tissierellia bacterium]|nr:tRNA 2-selenouridine(34) synthase MnmH [Tissierellia bacterium]